MDSDAAPPAAALGRWWGQAPQASPSTDVMNQLCRVCGEPAAGFHFGAFTCEGCKSFFGRTYNNLGSITDCKNNGECVINKKNRTACKACRLKKCLLVGMSKSGSRYGRRSNWFKIHCLLQEQQQAVGGGVHLKDKSGLALWGENYKSMGESKGSPTEDNNNLPKERDCSPSRALQAGSYSAEAAAALWAARHSLFPMQLPHHHLPALSVPYLPSFPTFPPPGHPQQRNMLLPFMHNLHASPSPHSPPSPQPPNHRPPTLSSPSSRASTCSASPPPRNHLDHNSSDRTSLDDRPDNKIAEEHSLALLRALGPVQDHPMDLSLRVLEVRARRKSKAAKRAEEDGDSSKGASDVDVDVGVVESEEEVAGDDSEKNDQNFSKRKKPLDLTKPPRTEL